MSDAQDTETEVTTTGKETEPPEGSAPSTLESTSPVAEKKSVSEKKSADAASKPPTPVKIRRQQAVLFFTCESPLASTAVSPHPRAGIARAITREPKSQYPLLLAEEYRGSIEKYFVRKSQSSAAPSFSDAQLLLFPLRSIRGIFTWVTSLKILQQFDAALKDSTCSPRWPLVGLNEEAFLTGPHNNCVLKEQALLEEHCFPVVVEPRVQGISRWLASNLFPTSAEFQWWSAKLARDLIIVPDSVLRLLVQQNLHFEVEATAGSQQVDSALASLVEFLPTETVLYATLGEGLAEAELEVPLISVGYKQVFGRGLCRLRLVTRANNKSKRRKRKPANKPISSAAATAPAQADAAAAATPSETPST